jgi:preprotein translocase subunit YajC
MPQLAFAVAPILAQADDGGGTNILGFLLPLVILGGLFYVMLYLPRRRQAKKAERMLEAISVGDEIRTIGGIFGTVRSEDDDSYTIDLGDGTRMRIAKRAIAERVGDDAE